MIATLQMHRQTSFYKLTNSGVWECFRKSGLRNSMSVNCLAFATESSIADYKTFDIEKYQRRRSNFRCAAIRWPVGRGSQRRNRVRKVSQPFMSGCDPH